MTTIPNATQVLVIGGVGIMALLLLAAIGKLLFSK